ncbi:MAG: response regulator [Caulobacteraceae bacterium]
MNSEAKALPAPQILVVDDDADLSRHVADYLGVNGYVVHTAANATDMERVMGEQSIELVVLDVMLPGESGLDICRRLADGRGPAVIILSAMGDEVDRIVGLELGADDYLAKPSNPRELLARVRAVLRRREAAPSGKKTERVHEFLGFRLDVARRQLKAPSGVVVLLTPGEFSLLTAFLDHPGRILSRDTLVELVRGYDADVFDRAIDVQISRLRRKLHAHSDVELIRTVRGAGYICELGPRRQ